MFGPGMGEIYFIAAMMVLILIFSGASVYIFFRQYKREMKERREMAERKQAEVRENKVPTADAAAE